MLIVGMARVCARHTSAFRAFARPADTLPGHDDNRLRSP